jgi:hypothetical protein
MRDSYSRRAALGFVLAAASALVAGCKNDEIPLVEFPKGAPPPPPPGKVDLKGPQGANTSQGDPSQYR